MNQSWTVIGLCFVAAIINGCASSQSGKLQPPASFAEQKQAILDLVPPGTSRTEALDILKSAGVEGNLSRVSDRIFYCDLWRRKSGDVWPLNVAVMFNQQNEVYRVQSTVGETDYASAEGLKTDTESSDFESNWAQSEIEQTSSKSNRDKDFRTPFATETGWPEE